MNTWTTHLNENETKFYFINDKRGSAPGYLSMKLKGSVNL
jgi:hypothetical protein